jgi:hypothetical protein
MLVFYNKTNLTLYTKRSATYKYGVSLLTWPRLAECTKADFLSRLFLLVVFEVKI